jgi:hypothetical protein
VHPKPQSEKTDQEAKSIPKVFETKKQVELTKVPSERDANKENIENKSDSSLLNKEKKDAIEDETTSLVKKSENKSDEKTEIVPAAPDSELLKESAYSSSRYADILDIDADDDDNPLLVKEYIQDICQYLFVLEVFSFIHSFSTA